MLSDLAGHLLRRLPWRRLLLWALVPAAVAVLLVAVRVVVAADSSALARRPLVIRTLDRSLVSLGSHPRTHVDPPELGAQADLPAAAALTGWLRQVRNSYYDNARASSKPIEVSLVRRSQPYRPRPGPRPLGRLEWMFRLTSVPCLQAGYQPPGQPTPPVDRDGCDEYLFLDARSGSSSAGFATKAGVALFVPA
jgi:hypothetical protein